MQNASLAGRRGRKRRARRHAWAILPAIGLAAASLTTAPRARADEPTWEEAPDEDEPKPVVEPDDTKDDEPASAADTAKTPIPAPSSDHVSACDAPTESPHSSAPPTRAPIAADLELSYGRLLLPVGNTTFGSSGWPDKKGRELGFENPLAHNLGFRSSFVLEPHFAATFGMSFAWAHSDVTGTDAQARQTTGWLFATDFLDLGLEGIASAGPLTFRAGGSLGPRILMLGMDHRSNNSNAVGTFQFYVRPRVAAELVLGDGFALGAYVSDDILRTTSVGVGGYLSFRSSGFAGN